jgi:NAD(P)-dependent dehydrogenase (short-subunit alcohol dehydrogenase family)
MTTWLITGASSGLGRALAGHVLATGHQVVATARNTSALEGLQSAYPDTAMVAPVDVTDASSIDAAVTAAEQRFHGIDVLVNNAGYGYTAAVEEGEDEAVARLFATDFFGPVALIKAALPGMRHREKGLIVNISSVGARITIPGGGYYSAAKAALEGVSGSLRKEVEPLGLRVMVVEPGSFRTDFRGRSADRSRVRIGAYDQVLGRTARPAIANPLPDTDGYDIVLLGSPVWNMRAPMIMFTLIESVDLTGKTILPFVTYAVSGMSGIDDDYRQALPGSNVRDGLAVQGETVTQAAPDLDKWLSTNDLA